MTYFGVWKVEAFGCLIYGGNGSLSFNVKALVDLKFRGMFAAICLFFRLLQFKTYLWIQTWKKTQLSETLFHLRLKIWCLHLCAHQAVYYMT